MQYLRLILAHFSPLKILQLSNNSTFASGNVTSAILLPVDATRECISLPVTYGPSCASSGGERVQSLFFNNQVKWNIKLVDAIARAAR